MDASLEATGETRFLSALPVVDQVLAFVCRRHHCSADDAEEFGARVRLKLVENDYGVLRQFHGRSSLRTFLAVVIERLFLDFRRQRWGVWRPTAEARRMGKVALRLDTLLHRDSLSLDEAIAVLRISEGVTTSDADLRALAARLPARRKRVEDEHALHEVAMEAGPAVEDALLADERAVTVRGLRGGLRETMGMLAAEDALVLKLRYHEGFTVGRIAELLGLRAKPLYRRIERILGRLRATLHARGFTAADLEAVLGDPAFDEPGGWETRAERGSCEQAMDGASSRAQRVP